jgi:hypothetical protein
MRRSNPARRTKQDSHSWLSRSSPNFLQFFDKTQIAR